MGLSAGGRFDRLARPGRIGSEAILGDRDEILIILGGLSLFADLSRPQLEAVAHTFEEEFFNEGQRIIRQGFSGGNFYVILEGEADVKVNGQRTARLGRGDFFGEVSILLGEEPIADVVATTPLRCLVLPGPEVQEFLVMNPTVMYRMLQSEARRLRAASQWRG
jgi:CRP/FNR family transcriptional regulator, cyclic AMP receptor protein